MKTSSVELVNSQYSAMSSHTALHQAALADDAITCQALLLSGTDRANIDDCGCTALNLSCYKGSMHVFRVLIVGACAVEINMPLDNSYPPHYFGSDWGWQHQTPLMSVILCERQEHRFEMLYALLSRWDVAVNAQDRCGDTALHLVMYEEYMDIKLCQLLLKRCDLDVNVQNKEGNTPLHILTSQGDDHLEGKETFVPHCVMCMLLCRRGLVPDLRNKDGDTPLHCAARCGNITLTRLLLFHGGADANIRNNQSQTPLECCLSIESGHRLRRLLASHLNLTMILNRGITLEL